MNDMVLNNSDYDLEVIAEYEKEKQDGTLKIYSFDEVMEELKLQPEEEDYERQRTGNKNG